MPAKGSKRKVASTPEPEEPPTPKKVATPRKNKGSPKKQSNGSPRKPSNTIFTRLAQPQDAVTPINVSFKGDAIQAPLGKEGQYSHLLKLEATRTFSLLESVVLSDGPHVGRQAIIILPAKAFPFLELPKEVRNRVYEMYFAQKGLLNDPIVFDGKRAATKEVFAKTYADHKKNRVGLLAVNKQICEEALPVLFATGFRFENTTTLVDFLAQIRADHRLLIRTVEIKNYSKASDRSALNFLVEAKKIKRLHIDSGVHTADVDPVKAAKLFMSNASKFLDMVGHERGNEAEAVDVLSFGRNAFTSKRDKGKDPVPWTEMQVEAFREELRKRMRRSS